MGMEVNSFALGLSAGNPMPLDPNEWCCSDFRQALESVCLLLDAGIVLSDIKPANFISIERTTSSDNDRGGDTRVMAIDLEDSLPGVGDGESQHFELPDWILRGSSGRLVSPY